MAEFFPPVNIGNMHFDKFNAASGDTVAEGDARMGKCAGIYYAKLYSRVGKFVNLVDDFTF